MSVPAIHSLATDDAYDYYRVMSKCFTVGLVGCPFEKARRSSLRQVVPVIVDNIVTITAVRKADSESNGAIVCVRARFAAVAICATTGCIDRARRLSAVRIVVTMLAREVVCALLSRWRG